MARSFQEVRSRRLDLILALPRSAFDNRLAGLVLARRSREAFIMNWRKHKRVPIALIGPVMPWSLASKWHLLGTLFLTIALPLTGLAVVVSERARAALREEAENQNRTTARLAALLVREHFNGLRHYIASIVNRPSFVDAIAAHDVARVEMHLRNIVDVNPAFDRSYVVDSEGIQWADYPHDPSVIGKSFAFRDWFKGRNAPGSLIFLDRTRALVVRRLRYSRWPFRFETALERCWDTSSPRTRPPNFRRG